MDDVLQKYKNLLIQDEMNRNRLEQIEEELNTFKVKKLELTNEQVLTAKVLESYNLLTSKLGENRLKHLEDLINLGLKQVFTSEDTSYSFRFELKRATNNNQIDLILIKTVDGVSVETNLQDNGFGIQSFINLIFRFFFIINENLPRVLFIDEGLTYISTDHLNELKAFLHQMCEKYHFAILLVAHDSDLFDLGDEFYVMGTNGVLKPGIFGGVLNE
jgi:DNA repair exonuclease SbcCD ATPase subunit